MRRWGRRNRKRFQRPPVGDALVRAGRRAGRVAQRVLPWALGVALAAGTVWSVSRYLTTTPYFRLRQTELSGLERFTEEDVRAWAGVDERTHLLTVDLKRVEANLRQQPWIADARVGRVLPDKLVIRVVERKPAALLLLDSLYLVDQHGSPFVRSDGQGAERLPILTGISPEEMTADPLAVRLRIQEALAVIREWSRQQLPELDELSEVHLDPVLGPILYTEETGTRIQLGWTDHALRLARLREVLRALRAEGKRPRYVLLDNEVTPRRVTVGLPEQDRQQGEGPG